MAEALLKAHLAEIVPGENWQVESAGTWTTPGQPAAPEARQVLSEKGIDLSSHRSREVSELLLNQFNLTLTMELGQKDALQLEFPFYKNQIYLLSEMTGVLLDLPDPSGGTPDQFRATASQIESLIVRGLPRIRELA